MNDLRDVLLWIAANWVLLRDEDDEELAGEIFDRSEHHPGVPALDPVRLGRVVRRTFDRRLPALHQLPTEETCAMVVHEVLAELIPLTRASLAARLRENDTNTPRDCALTPTPSGQTRRHRHGRQNKATDSASQHDDHRSGDAVHRASGVCPGQ